MTQRSEKLVFVLRSLSLSFSVSPSLFYIVVLQEVHQDSITFSTSHCQFIEIRATGVTLRLNLFGIFFSFPFFCFFVFGKTSSFEKSSIILIINKNVILKYSVNVLNTQLSLSLSLLCMEISIHRNRMFVLLLSLL